MGAQETEAALGAVLVSRRSGDDGSIARLETKGRVWLGRVGSSSQETWAGIGENQSERGGLLQGFWAEMMV
jgi:hypothetical protein